MWPFKKKPKPEYPAKETTFFESVIVANKPRVIEAGIQETGKNSGLYTTWISMGFLGQNSWTIALGGIHMPKNQATKAAKEIGTGFINHLNIQKIHLESTADD